VDTNWNYSDVASPSFDPAQKFIEADWPARLIPGSEQGAVRKRPTPVPRFAAVLPRQGDRNLDTGFSTSASESRPLSWPRRDLTGSRETRNVLIIGAGALGRKIARELESDSQMNRVFCGFLDDKNPRGNRVVGRTTDLARLARSVFVDEVILASPHDRDLALRVLQQARRLRLDVKLALDLFGCEAQGRSEPVGGIPLISLHEERLPATALLLKRALDVMGAIAALVLLVPVMALIAVWIKLDSRGPVLYAAPRAGHKGRPFRCYKFRTMVKEADALKDQLRGQNLRSGPFFKVTNDPRVTRVGRFLRRYSLDELPQLLNVLRGEMSLVGPRPHPLDDFSGYEIQDLPRLDVTPGITGLWQVTSRQNPSFQAGVKLDIEYIQRWSLLMDLRILLKTAGAVFRGTGQ
jgi:exopolysaccharide biosynthesis polyprenyl glycosylphosphotransferase